MKNSSRLNISAIIITALLLPGCVSRTTYDRDVGTLLTKIQKLKSDHALEVRALESKIHERGRSLNELTTRYMSLQEDNVQAQIKLGSLRGDLETLSKDVAELKLVIFTNVKGSEANEMMIKLIDMQNRIQILLEKEKNRESGLSR